MQLKAIGYDEVKVSKGILVVMILTSILLNHSNGQLGLNLSLADIFVIISIFLLIIHQELNLPKYSFLFFGFLSFVLLLVSTFYSPTKFNYNINSTAIIKDYIKLLACFLFFLFGYNISRLGLLKVNTKWYSIGAMSVGFVGLLLMLLNVTVLNNIMYFGNTRFRGLMNDPNYYSVIQCTALVYFIRSYHISITKKIVLYIMTFIFIAMSGSKTGMTTLGVYSFIIFIEYLFFEKKTYKFIFLILISLIGTILTLPWLLTQLNMLMDKLSELLPVFHRVQLLFEDFFSATVGEGSGRNQTWRSGIGVIKSSPIVGVGLGSYTTINNIIHGNNSVAHNTYIQVLAEWGIILGFIFFAYVFISILKSTFSKRNSNYNNEIFIIRDILIILLIGSLAISLNNARMFWVFLGGLVYYSNKSYKE